MMAKMFYTLDEAKTALGKSEEELKQFAREGRLREFRDGPRLMFKADQIEALKKELTGGGEEAAPSGSGMAGLSPDMRSGSGAGMTLSEESAGGRSPGAGMAMKDEATLAQDLGLSGSMGGVPSPGRPSGSGTGLSGTGGSRAGIDVFHADEVDRIDPSAQTVVAKAQGDQINLEGVGSGSGLLDLTRESDDTSLGAELLDEIAPAGAKPRKPGMPSDTGIVSGTGISPAIADTGTGAGRPSLAVPVYIEAPDAWAPAFGSAAMGAAIGVFFGIFALVAGMASTYPEIIRNISEWGYWKIALAGLGISVVFGIAGFIIGKVTSK